MENKIGPGLRQARQRQNLSLRSVAAAAGISPSLLSQVENGRSQASVSTLYALVTHLGISLDSLLGTGVGASEPVAAAGVQSVAQPTSEVVRPTSEVVQRAADNPVLDMANGVRWERLAGRADVDALLVTYEPGAASSADRTLMRHSGTEHAYLLSGELTLLLDFDRHLITQGDSLCFDSTRPHLYLNHGSEPARGVWFVTGRHELEHTRDWVRAQLGELPADGLLSPANVVDVLDLLPFKSD